MDHSQETLPPHVLIFPLPAQGHVNSMLKLAELLCLAGVHVTFLVSDHIHDRLLRHTDVHKRFEHYCQFRFQTISDGFPVESSRSGSDFLTELVDSLTVVKPLFRDLFVRSNRLSSKLNRPVTCIIADGVLSFAIDVAEEMGIPIIYFRTISACAFWAYFCIPQLIESGELPFKGNDLDVPIQSIPGMEAFLRRRDLPGICRVGDSSNHGLQFLSIETRATPRARAVILNTFEDLEGPILSHIRTQMPNVYTIGPLHAHLKTRLVATAPLTVPTSSNSIWEEDRSCMTWLDAQPSQSVIYVSFGSLTIITRPQLMEFWHGLVNSGKRFLWVIRPDLVTGGDGEGQIPTELLETTKERGYIVQTTTHLSCSLSLSVLSSTSRPLHAPVLKLTVKLKKMGTLCFSLSSLILFISVTEFFFQAYSTTYWADIETLKEFKNGLDPNSLSPGSCLSSWDFTLDPCDHLFSDKFTCGFRCDVLVSNNSRVTELVLDQAGYAGSLASTSWNFPYLLILDLSNNFFTGSIPDSLSNLTHLQRLSLSRNSLSGSVPTSIACLSTLEELFLDNNNLQGTISSALNGLKNLKRLQLQGNKLSGELPDLGQLSNLYFLDFSDNAISGELPATLPICLVQLSVRNNQIEGNIPANLISNMVYLQVMDLSHNNLSGSVPSGLFTHPSLQQLTLSFNQFESVQVPGDSGQNSELVAVDLGNNQIHGLLPLFMGSMPKLSALSLENNKFSGMIPTQYALKAVVPGQGVSRFERLLLGGNYLFGPIPGPLMRMRNSGSGTVRLGDNCLYWCPVSFFFCEGGEQKSIMECKSFDPVIP